MNILLLLLNLILSAFNGPIATEKEAVTTPSGFVLEDEPFLTKSVIKGDDTLSMKFLNNYDLYMEQWDTLAHPTFWQQVMMLSPDSAIINIARQRIPLETIDFKAWSKKSETAKDAYKRQLIAKHNLSAGTELYVTSGKSHYYNYNKILPDISQAIEIFEKHDVDPWFAQAILLIESPGNHKQKSYVGANGPFQLMPSIARKYGGLTVNRYVDERTDLKKSAAAAAKFIKVVDIPYTKEILDAHNLKYNEDDLWFRLMVLHVYHAGAGNVAAAVNKIGPKEGGMALIQKMWQVEAGGFKNQSQNYSQIALASLLKFDQMIGLNYEPLFLSQNGELLLADK